ncbi:hypothetical protein ABT126_28135 [Streptomyces sp. NPDC002012]|uniref:hypothetical protein n=1 Tax=Streptomyces sp. NPDC002012 TaxID=3154532 RepID=UPI00331AF146
MRFGHGVGRQPEGDLVLGVRQVRDGDDAADLEAAGQAGGERPLDGRLVRRSAGAADGLPGDRGDRPTADAARLTVLVIGSLLAVGPA